MQLSAVVGIPKFTPVAVQPLFVVFATGAGQVIVGFSLSVTVTVKLHVEVLPLASVTTKVFVVVPTGNTLPLARPAVCATVWPEQLSDDVTV